MQSLPAFFLLLYPVNQGADKVSQFVATNNRVLSQLEYARTVLNGSRSFRLFTNPVTLSPATNLLDLVEATFPGYTRINTSGYFPAPYKLTEGWYQCDSNPFEVTVTGESTNLVHGWSISTGADLLYAAKFAEPIPAADGYTFSVIVSLAEKSLSLCECP